MDNVSVGPVKDAPAPLAMAVVLRQANVTLQGSSADPKGGATFPWEPRALQGKAGACLSYHVRFPAGFDFQRGGALPGIGGADARGDQGDKFLARLSWRPKGVGGVTVRVTADGVASAIPAEREAFEFPVASG